VDPPEEFRIASGGFFLPVAEAPARSGARRGANRFAHHAAAAAFFLARRALILYAGIL